MRYIAASSLRPHKLGSSLPMAMVASGHPQPAFTSMVPARAMETQTTIPPKPIKLLCPSIDALAGNVAALRNTRARRFHEALGFAERCNANFTCGLLA